MTTCPRCGNTANIVNLCGCDPHNRPTPHDPRQCPDCPMTCHLCGTPEPHRWTNPCLPGYHHGFVTRRPGETSAEAEAHLRDAGYVCLSATRPRTLDDLATTLAQAERQTSARLTQERMTLAANAGMSPDDMPLNDAQPWGID